MGYTTDAEKDKLMFKAIIRNNIKIGIFNSLPRSIIKKILKIAKKKKKKIQSIKKSNLSLSASGIESVLTKDFKVKCGDFRNFSNKSLEENIPLYYKEEDILRVEIEILDPKETIEIILVPVINTLDGVGVSYAIILKNNRRIGRIHSSKLSENPLTEIDESIFN